eukprot:788634-Amphidinium_carterae.2
MRLFQWSCATACKCTRYVELHSMHRRDVHGLAQHPCCIARVLGQIATRTNRWRIGKHMKGQLLYLQRRQLRKLLVSTTSRAVDDILGHYLDVACSRPTPLIPTLLVSDSNKLGK